MSSKDSGWLKVVGTGIRLGQLTFEAQKAVVEADVVFALVTDELSFVMLRSYNDCIVDLRDCYALEKERMETYHDMADRVLEAVRSGQKVCFAIYGHPSVFAYPGLVAVQLARQEDFRAELLPGISAEDSIFTDLEFDPSVHGCQSYCASALVRAGRKWDPQAVLVLWQVSIIGETRCMLAGDNTYHQALCDRLEEAYGPSHPLFLYEAATNPYCVADIRKIKISELRHIVVRSCCTLVLPPVDHPDFIDVSIPSEAVTWSTWPSQHP